MAQPLDRATLRAIAERAFGRVGHLRHGARVDLYL